MKRQNLFPICGPEHGVDGTGEIRPVVWLMSPDESAPMLLTLEEAARLLGLDASRVLALTESGDLPVVTVTDETRVRLTDLAAYVQSLDGGQAREQR